METQKAFQIVKREWSNIRASLEMCGDIEEFRSQKHIKNQMRSGLTFVSGGPHLVRNLIEMDSKFAAHGYFTPEAANVFADLASQAGERLGLLSKFARAFGRGYSWVRTGCFQPNIMENQELIIQTFFYKFFFPLGENFAGWTFHSPAVQTKLKLIFDTFAAWQENPASFVQDVAEYRTELEPVWHGLVLTRRFPMQLSVA